MLTAPRDAAAVTVSLLPAPGTWRTFLRHCSRSESHFRAAWRDQCWSNGSRNDSGNGQVLSQHFPTHGIQMTPMEALQPHSLLFCVFFSFKFSFVCIVSSHGTSTLSPCLCPRHGCYFYSEKCIINYIFKNIILPSRRTIHWQEYFVVTHIN